LNRKGLHGRSKSRNVEVRIGRYNPKVRSERATVEEEGQKVVHFPGIERE